MDERDRILALDEASKARSQQRPEFFGVQNPSHASCVHERRRAPSGCFGTASIRFATSRLSTWGGGTIVGGIP
jgi:hypothetical protein